MRHGDIFLALSLHRWHQHLIPGAMLNVVQNMRFILWGMTELLLIPAVLWRLGRGGITGWDPNDFPLFFKFLKSFLYKFVIL